MNLYALQKAIFPADCDTTAPESHAGREPPFRSSYVLWANGQLQRHLAAAREFHGTSCIYAVREGLFACGPMRKGASRP
jgi:hypothetical protein